jgi:imidazolonepropionase
MPVLRHIGVLARCRLPGGQSEIHAQRDAALAWGGAKILWAGPDDALPTEYRSLEASREAEGRLVLPGLIDCHTHLAFGGWREDEFEQRIRGCSYQEIAARGGGILRTVAATRSAKDEELSARCRVCLAAMAALGVTTVEAKSGYGLTVEQELRILRIYARLGNSQVVRIVPTLLAAHAVPPEYLNDRAGYIRQVVQRLIPETAQEGLARFCDAFVEDGAFTAEEARTILRAAIDCGLRPKLHADQLTDSGGAALAAELGCVSADHLDCISHDGIRRLAERGTVAVNLPLTSLYLGRPPLPARELIDHGVPVAVATDFNPGTAPSFHLPLAMLLACTLQRMAPAEALKGATLYAARAIGEEDRCGSIEPNKRADFVIIDAPSVNHWIYHFASNRCVATYVGGKRVSPVVRGE